MNKKETINIKIKKEIKKSTNKLLLKNLSFKEWNQEQQHFGTILYLKILTIQEIYDFSCCLIYSKVNCSTIKEKDELINKKEAIKRFMKGISNPDYIKAYIEGNKNVGDLYKEEISQKEPSNNFNENKNDKTK
mgnify:FL=1